MLRRVPAAGAQTNYPIEITVSDPMAAAYPYLAANPSFQVVSEDMFGGSNGQASQYGTIYSYEAGYAPNGNVVTYADSVMGTWNFSYDAADRLISAQNADDHHNGTTPRPRRVGGCSGGCSFMTFMRLCAVHCYDAFNVCHCEIYGYSAVCNHVQRAAGNRFSDSKSVIARPDPTRGKTILITRRFGPSVLTLPRSISSAASVRGRCKARPLL